MQLEQPPPDLPVPEATPFDHLRPTLWHASKVAHIVLVSLGTLMLLPAGIFLLLIIEMSGWFGRGSSGFFSMAGADPGEQLMVIGMFLSCCTGVLAWAALSILFFKRNDARWQRICWAFAAVYGSLGSLTFVGVIIAAADEFSHGPDAAWPLLILLSLLGASIAAAVCGIRYSRSAQQALRHPPTPKDREIATFLR